MLLHSALADQFRQGPLYSGTGKAEIFGHGVDGGSVKEFSQNGLQALA